jgi:hypothetical protein
MHNSEKYGISLLESFDNYIDNLKAIGKNSNKTLKDLMLYNIIYDLYQSVEWNEWHELVRISLQRKMNSIILNNTDFKKLKITPGYHPTNVNTEQGLYTWRSIFNISTDLKNT